MEVPLEASRDHLGECMRLMTMYQVLAAADTTGLALERTFLAYLHTSLNLAAIGTLVIQLFRLEYATDPDPIFGFYIISKPVAAMLIVGSTIISGLGGYRFIRQQKAMLHGKILAGGVEVTAVGGIISLVRPCPLLIMGGRGTDRSNELAGNNFICTRHWNMH